MELEFQLYTHSRSQRWQVRMLSRFWSAVRRERDHATQHHHHRRWFYANIHFTARVTMCSHANVSVRTFLLSRTRTLSPRPAHLRQDCANYNDNFFCRLFPRFLVDRYISISSLLHEHTHPTRKSSMRACVGLSHTWALRKKNEKKVVYTAWCRVYGRNQHTFSHCLLKFCRRRYVREKKDETEKYIC